MEELKIVIAVVYEIYFGFTKQYRAADGGQPAVIRVRK
jgi:hypothetical protein